MENTPRKLDPLDIATIILIIVITIAVLQCGEEKCNAKRTYIPLKAFFRIKI